MEMSLTNSVNSMRQYQRAPQKATSQRTKNPMTTGNAARQTAGTPQANGDFSGQVMKCVSAGGQKVMLSSDALIKSALP